MQLHRLRSLQRRRPAALFGLLLAALFLRGLLAPGVMPGLSADGISVVLCTPEGARTVWTPGEGGGSAPAMGGECAFALALSMPGLPAGSALPAFGIAAATQAVADKPGLAPATARRPYEARGPPRRS